MKNLFLLFLLLVISQYSHSQVEELNTDSLVVVTLYSGETRIGKIISDDGREILLVTKEIGKIYIRKENIKSITPYIASNFQEVRGELRDAGPFTTRYFFTTNSLPIKKGENYALLNLYGPEVHFALSDRFSLGVMSTWIASPFVLAAKYTIPTKNEKLNFGLGSLIATSGYLNTFKGYGGLHWGMVSYGNRLNNITLSVGYSYVKTGIEQEGVYLFEPGFYPAIEDVYNPGTFYFNYAFSGKYYGSGDPKGLGTAPILGIGGITKVGKKASFIFDAMIMFGSQRDDTYNQTRTDVYDSGTGQPSYTEVGEIQKTTVKTNTTIGFFMPGMRFQKKDDRAFQVALAGILYANENETQAFPIPMVSWFFKF